MSRAIKITLKAIDPLVITDGSSEGQAHRCLDYIPGSMLLGALASLWVRKNKGKVPDNDNEFRSLFLGNAVRFLNAYPLHGNSRTWPSPLSLKYIKNQPGIPEDLDNGSHPVITNSLAFAKESGSADLERNEAKDLYSKRFPGEPNPNIQLKKVKPCFINPGTCLKAAVAKQWNMHVAIDEKTRRAADEKLFGYEAISSGAIFESAVLFESDDNGTALKNLFENIEYLWVGHSRSAGYGKCKCEITPEDINDYTKASAPDKDISEGEAFNILLLSDYVAKDGWTPPFEGLLSDLKEELGSDVTLHSYILPFSAQREVPGFNSKWRLPRPTRAAIAKGSVITFTAGKNIEGSMITQVMRKGIGGLRREGFGRICVNPGFLNSETLEFPTGDEVKAHKSGSIEKPGSAKSSTALRVLRKRALRRISDDAARRFLASEAVRKFLDGVNNKQDLFKKPSNTQLSNIRAMAMDLEIKREKWAESFKEMLEKTPGKQWEQCAVKNNFMPGGDEDEHLSEVMKDFLNTVTFSKLFNKPDLVDLERLIRNLPGGPVSNAERNRALERIHRLAVSGLMEAVIVLRRIKEIKEAEGRGGEKL